MILIIFFFKLYNVRPDLIKWTNIAFGYSVFQFVFSMILGVFSLGLKSLFNSGSISLVLIQLIFLFGVIPLTLVLAIIIVVWPTFVNHLKKAQRENLMDFS